ncbi:MAG: FAD-dependent oxidoreductase [Verrucomicrobiales bacterium]|nr:FAD-dependent oxidoreductase [Verrucomicrobiales bacterium]
MKRFLIPALVLVGCGLVSAEEPENLQADLLVVGATESGWAAAIQAARMGVGKVIIVHDGEWFGGQYTEQALACVDEDKGNGKVGWGVDWHPMKRSFHRSGLFKELMDRIESENVERYGSKMPGRPYHGPSTFRPAEAEEAFRSIIQPYLDSGQISVVWNHYPVSAKLEDDGNRLIGVGFAPVGDDALALNVDATMTIDASDWGEVVQVAGAEYEVGPDPKSRYNEPSASETVIANEMNPLTWAMIIEESPDGSDTPIAEPANFDDRNYPRATHFSRKAFGTLEWDRKASRGSIPHWPDGGAANTSPRQLSVFTVRRIVDGFTSKDGKTSILLNYMNGQDYPLMRLPRRVTEALEATEAGASEKNIVEMTRAQRAIIFEDAKKHSLGVLYHMQNFVHEHAPDKSNSFRKFRLSREFGTSDNLPPKPYIRESLRLKAMYMMREQDGRNRDGETKEAALERFAPVMYPDGLFAWQFHYDFHRTGRTYLKEGGEDGPWIDYETPGRHTRHVSDRSVFPARSLVPVRMDGLLGAQGNVGNSSIVSAAIRLHDQRVHVGQASGAMAAVSLLEKVDPREIVYDRGLLESVRDGLCGGAEGVPLLLYPWRDLKPEDPWFVAVNRLSVQGGGSSNPQEVDFRGEAELKSGEVDLQWLNEVEPSDLTRGEAAQKAWSAIAGAELGEVARKSQTDADGDGIPDLDDALLFTPNEPVVWKVELASILPENDGLIEAGLKGAGKRFDFAGKGVPAADGFTRDRGAVYSKERGFGWARDISANARVRNQMPEHERDAFLFTRKEDIWEVGAENGDYEVTVCVGDSGHGQKGQYVRVEGESLISNVDTTTGRFHEATATVSVSDGRLTVTIGRPGGGSNTALCWLALRKVD